MKPQHCLYIVLFLLLSVGLQAQQWEQVMVPNVNNIENLIVSPNADIVMTTGDSIIHCSFDGCQTWEALSYPQWDENQYPEFHVFIYSLNIDIQNALYVSARYKKGNNFSNMLLKSVDTARTWYKVHEDTTGTQGLGVMLYSSNNGIAFMRGWKDGERALFRSLDYGESWNWVYSIPSPSENYMTDIEMNNNGETYISIVGYVMPNSGLYYSADTATNISLIETLAGYDVYGLAKNSQDDIYAACWDHYINPPGGIFVKYNYSNDWIWLNPHFHLFDIVINSKDYIYVTNGSMNMGVFVSYDNGITFEKMSDGLPGYPKEFNQLYLDKNEYLYAFYYDTDDSRIYKTKHSTIATQDVIDSNLAITHYPNPVHDILHIMTPKNQHATKYKVQIYDMQVQLQHQEVTSTLNINVGHLSAGIYTYTIQYENQFFTNTFVKY